MNANSSADPKNAASQTYDTPNGEFQGMPPIDYPDTPGFTPKDYVPVGGTIIDDKPIEYNVYRYTKKLKVRNTGDRPIQIGSHFHFFEVNRYIEFDRPEAFGYHLNIPATTAIRFEPGDEKEVEIVTFAGKRYVMGFNNLTDGYTGGENFPTYYPAKTKALRKMAEYGFKSVSESDADAGYTQSEKKG